VNLKQFGAVPLISSPHLDNETWFVGPGTNLTLPSCWPSVGAPSVSGLKVTSPGICRVDEGPT